MARNERRGDPTPPATDAENLAFAAIVVPLLLAGMLLGSYLLVVGFGDLFHSSLSVDLPIEARLLGLALLAGGVTLAAATYRYRSPRVMLASTGLTFRKLMGLVPLESSRERTEPFVVVGPYRYVRNPLYLGVELILWGSGILLSSVVQLVWGGVLFAWFALVLVPFEERELRMLFGARYIRYCDQVPRFFPYRRAYTAPT